MLTEKYDFFNSTPDMDSELLMQLETNKQCRQEQAYLAYNASNNMIVYFPDGGKVRLDLREYPQTYKVEWLKCGRGTVVSSNNFKRRWNN